MPWWGWVTVGTMLLVAELTVVDFEFYLVFLGISALLVGALGLAGVVLPFWVQWMVFAGLAIASLVFFRRRIYVLLRPPPDEAVQVGVAGDLAVAVDAIAPGEAGTVRLRGTNWTGRNCGDAMIPAGAECVVERSKGLVLELHLAD